MGAITRPIWNCTRGVGSDLKVDGWMNDGHVKGKDASNLVSIKQKHYR